MKPSANTTRLCRGLLSSPRVVSTAAAVQPKPMSTEKAARPVSPTRRNSPSDMNASADRKPLSSIRNSAKYKMAICGTKERSMPTLENRLPTNAAATGAPAPATSEARNPPHTSETSHSHPSLSRTPGIFWANAKKNTASMATANRGNATYLLYRSAAARPSPCEPADHTPASSSSAGAYAARGCEPAGARRESVKKVLSFLTSAASCADTASTGMPSRAERARASSFPPRRRSKSAIVTTSAARFLRRRMLCSRANERGRVSASATHSARSYSPSSISRRDIFSSMLYASSE